ncbi:MAG: hypothetical protein KGQ57_09020 [Burkholderiales bacterium]|nr:hypothetical protein [Burkholderiales bacterium]
MAPEGTASIGFTSEEAIDALTEHLLAHREALGIVPQPLVTREDLKANLRKGERLPFLPDHEVWTGVIGPSGQVQSNDPQLMRLMEQVDTSKIDLTGIPSEGLPIAVRAKSPAITDALQTFLEGRVIEHFGAEGEFPLRKKDDTFEFQETVAWPFFRELIAGRPPMPANRDLIEEIAALPAYEIVAPGVAQETVDALTKQMAAKRLQLLGVDLAELQYSGRVDPMDTVRVLSLSTLGGTGGDVVIRAVFPEDLPPGTAAYVLASAARTFVLVIADAVDNFIGELETARGDLAANNLTPSLKALTGEERLRDVAMKVVKREGIFNGEGGIFARRAVRAGMKGAGTGAALAFPLGLVLSTPDMNPWLRAALGGALSVGSALSIPFDFREAVKQVQSAVLALMDEGKIPQPEGGFADENEKAEYAYTIAVQELVARQSNSSSAKAFSASWLVNAGILGTEAIGVPRALAEPAFVGLSPVMENLLKAGYTVADLKRGRPNKMDDLRQMVLTNPGPIDGADEEKYLAHAFAGRWPKGVAQFITTGARAPRQGPEDVAGQPADA